MIKQEELIAVTYSFLSYAFRDPDVKHKIKNIYLFGSVARGDFGEKSDIDVFFDVEKKDEIMVKKIVGRALNKFYRSEVWQNWKLRGIKNELKPNVGWLEEWDLKTSIEKEGILLYSRAPTAKLVKHLLFTLEPVKIPAKRIRIIRKLYGRKEKGYEEKGLVQKYNGTILSPRHFMIRAEGQHEITTFLSSWEVSFKFVEVWI